jgi:hypothetical protein
VTFRLHTFDIQNNENALGMSSEGNLWLLSHNNRREKNERMRIVKKYAVMCGVVDVKRMNL